MKIKSLELNHYNVFIKNLIEIYNAIDFFIESKEDAIKFYGPMNIGM